MLALVLVAALGCGDLCAGAARGHYADLLRSAGYGRFEFERGGFLIRERSGDITFAPWASIDFRRASFHGSIPEGTIAIVHTHPVNAPRPSARDRAEARRLGLPVVVVAPQGVVAAMPDGSERELWTAGLPCGAFC
jgi:hypothetical protein